MVFFSLPETVTLKLKQSLHSSSFIGCPINVCPQNNLFHPLLRHIRAFSSSSFYNRPSGCLNNYSQMLPSRFSAQVSHVTLNILSLAKFCFTFIPVFCFHLYSLTCGKKYFAWLAMLMLSLWQPSHTAWHTSINGVFYVINMYIIGMHALNELYTAELNYLP